MADKNVKFGLFDHIELTSGSSDIQTLYKERIALIQHAEKVGIWGYHLAEHHCTPLSAAPSPGLFLSALATHTSTIRLGPMVFLLPFYNPLRLIQEIGMLDNMSGGRLEFGIGRGVHPYEHAYYGIPTLQSSAIFEESLDIILKGLTADHLTYKGDFYRFDGVPVMDLKPVQKPYPGLWYGAVKESSILFAAKRGLHICTNGPVVMNKRAIDLYRETRAKYWKSPEDLQPHVKDPMLAIQRFVLVGETEAEAVNLARERYSVFLQNINKLYSYYGLTDNKVVVPFDQARNAEVLIAGAPEQVHEVLASQIEKTGCNYMMLNFTFGSLTAAETRASFDLFATKVFPRLTQAEPLHQPTPVS
ncbi:MAG: LLM class flavin-dependent oxidoreductase [Caulobacteraceae bacterium]|nr:LLM class flavin-dependent oxidoreductase [Caulobacteraceae bacterium]